jgi:hypothetical protein
VDGRVPPGHRDQGVHGAHEVSTLFFSFLFCVRSSRFLACVFFLATMSEADSWIAAFSAALPGTGSSASPASGGVGGVLTTPGSSAAGMTIVSGLGP